MVMRSICYSSGERFSTKKWNLVSPYSRLRPMTEPRKQSAPTLGDMSSEEFRRFGHELIDWIADYLERVEDLPVLA